MESIWTTTTNRRTKGHADFRFYGDNTEFFTDFRTGETLLGAQVKTWVEFRTSRHTAFQLGIFGDELFKADTQFDEILLLVGFRYSGGKVDVLLGTLETVERHGMLEALSVRQLEITRPVETGIQLLVHTPQLDGDLFLNWQKLNTPASREVFDYGARLHWSVGRRVTLSTQLKGWHQGGQLFAAGMPVINNLAGGVGVGLRGPLGRLGKSSADVYVLFSTIDVPPVVGAAEDGHGVYLRLASRPALRLEIWLAAWRGEDFFAVEGDRHYSSVGQTTVVPEREYQETGARYRHTGRGNVRYDLDLRLHSIEGEVDYSYRFIARVPLRLGRWRPRTASTE